MLRRVCPLYLVIIQISLNLLNISVQSADENDFYDNDYMQNDEKSDAKSAFYLSFQAGKVTKYFYCLVIALLGWVALLYAFLFHRRYCKEVYDFEQRGVAVQGRVIGSRIGRLFNPFRFFLPSKYNCYLSLEYEVSPVKNNGQDESTYVNPEISVPAVRNHPLLNTHPTPMQLPLETDQGSTPGTIIIRKEFCVSEAAYSRLFLTLDALAPSNVSAIVNNDSRVVNVFTYPEYPNSGCLGVSYQGMDLSPSKRMAYGVGGLFLLFVSVFSTFVSNGEEILDAGVLILWLLILSHFAAFLLAYWGCNFVNRSRVEALFYATPPREELLGRSVAER